MPAKFEKCVREGGRVRTIKSKGEKATAYVPVCFPKGGGPSVSGEVKHRKKK